MLRERFCPASILALPLGMTWLAAPAAGQQTHGPVVIGTPVTPIVVTVKPPPPSQGEAVASQDEGRIIPEGEPLPVLPPVPHKPLIDPVFQQPVSKKDVPTTDAVSAPIVNVAGLFSSASPPDTTGDVGPNHFIQMVNATPFQIFNKTGAPLTGAISFGSLWTPAKGNSGDPIVVYDHLADRWVLSQF